MIRTIHIDGNVGYHRLGVVIVVPPALQLAAHVLPVQVLQLHCVPAFAR